MRLFSSPFETFRFPLRTLKISQIHLVQDPPGRLLAIITNFHLGVKFWQNFVPKFHSEMKVGAISEHSLGGVLNQVNLRNFQGSKRESKSFKRRNLSQTLGSILKSTQMISTISIKITSKYTCWDLKTYKEYTCW